MAFWSDKLVVSLVTTHLRLARVPARDHASRGRESSTFYTVDLVRRSGSASPRVAIAGLNPHAGEQGLLGKEEITAIEPGITAARGRLKKLAVRASLEGPVGAETAIRKAVAGAYDAVVAMYHDQATIPMKLIGFGDAVNVTLASPSCAPASTTAPATTSRGPGAPISGGCSGDRARRKALPRQAHLAPRARAARDRKASAGQRPARTAVSRISVTGPSFSTMTRMSAPKRPVADPWVA